MDLLKGLIFVPKEKRSEVVNENLENKKRKHDRKSDDQKKKKDKRKEKPKKEKKSHNHKLKSSSYQSDTSSDDDDADNKDFSKYENEIADLKDEDKILDGSTSRMNWMESSTIAVAPSSGSMLQKGGIEKSIQQKSNFLDLIGSLSKPEKTVEKETAVESKGSDSLNSSHSTEMVINVEKVEEMKMDLSSSSNRKSDSDKDNTSMTGNQSMAALLRARLKGTKGSLKGETSASSSSSSSHEEVVFGGEEWMKTQINNKMRKINNNDSKQQAETDRLAMKADAAKGSRNGKLKQSNSGSESYEKIDLKSLIAAERLGGDDMDEIFRENVLRLGDRYTGTELAGSGAFGNGDAAGMDEEADIDMKLFQRQDSWLTDNAVSQKQMSKAVSQHKKQQATVAKCEACVESSYFRNHLTLSRGQYSMLRLKVGAGNLGKLHCVITPINHVESLLKCDEEVAVEVQRYKSCLRRMFEREGQAVLFLETALRFGKKPHAFIDVVPIPLGYEGETRMCFKEAFSTGDVEWAQHKKVIDLTVARPLDKAIPKQVILLQLCICYSILSVAFIDL
jgi:hypothetical protein